MRQIARGRGPRRALFAVLMRCGEACPEVLELLEGANTGRFGHPLPTNVTMGHHIGQAILVCGHDLKDLAGLLEMTAVRGINVYPHGELLPAHGYPALSKLPHLAGHYGGVRQNQKRQLATFPGPILMTTSSLMRPWTGIGNLCSRLAWSGIPV
jgi:hydroxylamine reductase